MRPWPQDSKVRVQVPLFCARFGPAQLPAFSPRCWWQLLASRWVVPRPRSGLFVAAAAAGGALYVSITCKRFAKEAWKYSLLAGAPALSKRVVDLVPHTESDYNFPVWIWTLRAGTAAALAVLALYCARATGPINWPSVAFVPAVALYAQAGLLLIRRSLAEWRVCGIPGSFAEPALAWRSEARAFHIFCFEMLRSWVVLFLLIWSLQTAFPGLHAVLETFRHFFVWPLVASATTKRRWRYSITTLSSPPCSCAAETFSPSIWPIHARSFWQLTWEAG